MRAGGRRPTAGDERRAWQPRFLPRQFVCEEEWRAAGTELQPPGGNSAPVQPEDIDSLEENTSSSHMEVPSCVSMKRKDV